MMKFEERMERLSPPGYDWKGERKSFLLLVSFAVLFSLFYLGSLSDEISALYVRHPSGSRVLREGHMCENFADTVDGWFRVFPLVSLVMLLSSALRYGSFFFGSKSIYTMRRLPDRWDLPRRTLVLPLGYAAAAMLLALLLLLLYYLIYCCSVPEGHMTPGQWELLMDWLLGGWRYD